jgi:MFS family permease
MITLARRLGQNYAFVAAGVVFLALLVSAGLRSAPGVMIVPLEHAFGWRRDVISLSAAIGIFLYGLAGPFAAALMQRLGIRTVLIAALALMSVSTAASAFMTSPIHLMLTWGVLTGLGSGCVAVVLGAAVVNRWFAARRGLMMGLLTASAASGTLVFMPVLAALAQSSGWKPVVWTVAIVCAALIPLVVWLLPEHPTDVGLRPYGASEDAMPQTHLPAAGNLLQATFGALARAARTRAFWFLFATFFICGFTTNGLIGTHFIALCSDRGLAEVQAAGLLAAMGAFDLVGTTLSGWLTDRYDPRKLLFVYYALRGLSLIFLPFSDFSFYSLGVFTVFYGLDWIATVPPTLRLANEAFGERDAPVVFGWIVAGHQLGAACAAFFAGAMRTVQGDYFYAFIIAGATGVVAAILALQVRGVRGGGSLARA